MVKVVAILCALAALALGGAAQAAPLSGPALVAALHQGGYVLLMRHASSPRTPPASGEADPDNTKLERQLDETGRDTARAMGAAFKALRIPIGSGMVEPDLSGPRDGAPGRTPDTQDRRRTWRRRAEHAGDGGQPAAWLKTKIAEPPRAGTDTIIVTHFPNIMAIFGQAVAGMADGETLILHPDGKGGTEIVGRVKIEDWPVLAAQP